MKRDVKGEGRALQRIVMLLFALANLAERAAVMPFAPRAIVLAILGYAEAAAWAFALGAPAFRLPVEETVASHKTGTLPGAPVDGDDGPAGLTRLASSLRLLALLVAGWATKALSSTAVPSPVHCARTLKHPGSTGGWQGSAAPPAPDTS